MSTPTTTAPYLPDVVLDFLKDASDSIVIDGKRQRSASGETIDCHDPGTGAVIAKIARGRVEDVDRAVASARHAFDNHWRGMNPNARARCLFSLAELIDSNVDAFMRAMKGPATYSYEARRAFVRRLSRKIDLSEMRAGLTADNPRIVQQAMYLFMSWSNRRAIGADCMHRPGECALCPRQLASLCPVRDGVRRLPTVT